MKTVHIISHSHWDREWYLPYERHHMLLIELIDDVLELFEKDPEFKSFYLDGQTIILDDYLQVRPEKRELLQKYIDKGQLKIGPFYILQDAFLTSSESNVRNMLIGHQESAKWNAKTDIGYYPDTFGNAGQTPQLMKQLGIDLAAFGRGVKPTGFANQSSENDNFVSSYSEMNWKGADGTDILGLLFANWYSNGNEIPADSEQAKAYWDQKLKDAETYASTDHLLFMNGCDHQPVQKDLSKAIQTANELYPDYQFIHSDFTTYIEKLHAHLPEDLDTVMGELTSQETEGWYTLTNTASSRVYLKQKNTEIARLLENIAEPLATMAYDVTGKYPHDVLNYAWKVYMQNHPHDSICGCSVDDVHDEMETRFQKAENIAHYVIDESLKSLSGAVDTNNLEKKEAVPFVVFNTSDMTRSAGVKTILELDKIYFQESYPAVGYNELLNKDKRQFKVVDSDGNEVNASIKENKPRFNYDLPKDKFRQPYMSRQIEVDVYVEDIDPFSWRTFYLVPTAGNSETEKSSVPADSSYVIENNYLKISVEENGTLKLVDKVNGYTYDNALMYEDTGDIGNEYVYKQPKGEQAITSTNTLVKSEWITNTSTKQVIKLTHVLDVPMSADSKLYEEQNKVIEFRNRESQRVEETIPLEIETLLTLEKNSEFVNIRTHLTNEMKDHRIRVRFKTGIMSSVHYADTLFETVKRPNSVSKEWTNPENTQRMHHFANVCDEQQGVVLSSNGLNEYEVIQEDGQLTVALTLLRAVGEMGDWGYFPTPGAQLMNRSFDFEYAVGFHGNEGRNRKLKESKSLYVPLVSQQTDRHDGILSENDHYLEVSGDNVAITALKRNQETNAPVSRLYNLTSESTLFHLSLNDLKPFKSTILENTLDKETQFEARPFEIITYLWKEEDL